jgi:hypothetical protein
MADLLVVAGAKFYIGATHVTQTTDFVAADLSGDVYTLVDGWKTMGKYGDSSALITTDIINRGRTTKQKGTTNAGNMQNVFAEVNGDAGQAMMRTAQTSKNNYSFKIVYDDSLGVNGTTEYFIGLVMNWAGAGGDANTDRDMEATIEINSNIVRVDAA